MATRTPLVLVNGQIQQLQAGDVLAGGGSTFDNIYTSEAPGGVSVSGLARGTTIVTNSYALVLASDNSALLRS
jgi:hypothetical protein